MAVRTPGMFSGSTACSILDVPVTKSEKAGPTSSRSRNELDCCLELDSVAVGSDAALAKWRKGGVNLGAETAGRGKRKQWIFIPRDAILNQVM